MTTNYSITIKCIQQGVYATPSAVLQVFRETIAKSGGISCGYDFEQDSIGRWHLHGHFLARKNLFLKKLQKRGWTIYITHLSDIDQVRKWANYMHKQDSENVKIIRDALYPFDLKAQQLTINLID